MKSIVYLFIIIFITALVPATAIAQKGNKTPQVEYAFPNEMAADIQKQYKELADKGLILYQLTCAKCHNSKAKGKDVIPDFTIEQLELYQIRIANATHESQLTESSLNAEELSLITTFFMYKKKNDVKVAKKK